MKKKLHIGLFGFGNVGMGVANILLQHSQDYTLSKICVRDTKKTDFAGIPKELFTDVHEDILNNDSLDVIIEVIGGTTVAKKIIETALQNKKHVITANKALLAEHGNELFTLAKANGVFLLFEASVGGGIPIIRTLQTHYMFGNISKVSGIVNGTCNFILSEIEKNNTEYSEVLKEAQKNGFAEKDPTFDVEGYDAAQKLAIISHLAFGGEMVDWKKIPTTGISHLHASDFAFAKSIGKKIRLIVSAEKNEHNNTLSLSVTPEMVNATGALGSISGATNIITIQHEYLGEIALSGAGAGRYPTAMSVLSDLHFLLQAERKERSNTPTIEYQIAESEFLRQFYFRFFVHDESGVLAKIATVFATHNASISEIKNAVGSSVPMSIVTHPISHLQKIKIIEDLSTIESITDTIACIPVS